MSAIQLILDGAHNCVSFPLLSKGSDGVARPCSFVLHTTDYAVGCVNFDSNGVEVRGLTVGTLDVNITGHSQNGTPMTPLTLNFEVTIPPPPQADHFEIGDLFINDGFAKPANPGTDSVNGNL